MHLSVCCGDAGFDSNVQTSKEKALDALKQIPDINELIIGAVTGTKDAEAALSSAESDALSARNTAEWAKSKAQEVSEVSEI